MNAVAQTMWNIFDAGLNLFYPAVCQFCREQRATYDESYMCGDCRKKVRVIDGPFCSRCGIPYDGEITGAFYCGECADVDLKFDAARAAVRVNAFMLDVVHRYKYGRSLWLEKLLGEYLVQTALPQIKKEQWDFIVPVPLHPVKQRQREFNQSGNGWRATWAISGRHPGEYSDYETRDSDAVANDAQLARRPGRKCAKGVCVATAD